MKPKEMLTFWMFLFSYSITVLISITEHIFFPILILNKFTQITFLIIFILGLLLRLKTRLLLGKNFHINIVIREDHTLTQKGIYRYIRHPMYLANILIFLGIAGAFSSMLGILTTLFFIIPTTILRIEKEEKYLQTKFKNTYKKYQKETYKIIPYIY